MKVATIINPKAGKVSVDAVKSKIQKALFRCYLDFYSETDIEGLKNFIEDQIQMEVDYFVVVGGDGTVNLIANIAMALREKGFRIPPICLVSLGTANDLAYELGVDIRIDRAVQAIFSGKKESVDLLKITSGDKSTYMFTNGGIGLTAQTAKAANQFRNNIRKSLASKNPLTQIGSQIADTLVEAIGPNIYNLLLVQKWINWKSAWEVEIETDDGYKLQTKSPFVLINNQKTLARRFHTAPATKNNDGHFNILILNQEKSWKQVRNVMRIGSGRWVTSDDLISKEVSSLSIKSLSPENPLTFIGDGELLQENVDSIQVTCVHPGLEMIFDRGVHK